MKVALVIADRTDRQEGAWSDDRRITYSEFVCLYTYLEYTTTRLPRVAHFVKSGVYGPSR